MKAKGKEVKDYSASETAPDLLFGSGIVSIPREHRMGVLESASILRLEFENDPRKHIAVVEVSPLKSERFFKDVSARVSRSRRREALVFIHGFDVSFEDSLRRTAQIAYDLAFDGAPIVFSWPSRSVPVAGTISAVATLPGILAALPLMMMRTEYMAAEENADRSAILLRQFLDQVRLKSGATTVHLICHSMGVRPLARALQAIDETRGNGAAFRQVILAAPNLDVELFEQLATTFPSNADRVTLYASSQDPWLALSHQIHDHRRAGESGQGIVVMPGIDTIDVSAIDTSLDGHFYYADNRSVLSDIFVLLRSGSPPQKRFGIVSITSAAGVYYLFRP
jgi:esterase/lipase superfamily enzyme